LGEAFLGEAFLLALELIVEGSMFFEDELLSVFLRRKKKNFLIFFHLSLFFKVER
jgi:hypothetical protein